MVCDIVSTTCESTRLRVMHVLSDIRLAPLRSDKTRLTAVERLEFVTSDFGIVHALQEWMNACIFLAPEIVRN